MHVKQEKQLPLFKTWFMRVPLQSIQIMNAGRPTLESSLVSTRCSKYS